MFVGTFSEMTSELVLLNHGYQGWVELKIFSTIAGCFTAKYLSWMNDFNKSSIVFCSLSTFAAHSLLAAPFNPSSVMAAVLSIFLYF